MTTSLFWNVVLFNNKYDGYKPVFNNKYSGYKPAFS